MVSRNADLIALAANETARALFNEIQLYNTMNKTAYRNELLNNSNLKISGPTFNKYIKKLIDCYLIITNYTEIETSESFISIETNEQINRARKIWVRIFQVPDNKSAEEFKNLISNF